MVKTAHNAAKVFETRNRSSEFGISAGEARNAGAVSKIRSLLAAVAAIVVFLTSFFGVHRSSST
jgi:hypothetical protein